MAIAVTALALCIIFPILAIASVIGRFLARARSKASYAADDWIIIPALILSIGNAANVLWGAKVSRLGQHELRGPNWQHTVGPEIVALQKMGYISELVVTVAITLARLSIILFYVRIFPSKKFRSWAIAIGLANVLFGIVFFFIFTFQCIPINQFWLVPHNMRHHCIDATVNDPYAIISVFLDVAVLCMPWPIVWNLQLRLKQKIAVLSIFMLGSVIVAVSIGKAYAFFSVFKTVFATQDYSYAEAPLLFWTVPECCLSVVCACLPTLAPLFRNVSMGSAIRSFKNLLSLRSFTSRSQGESLRHAENESYKKNALSVDSNLGNESKTGICKGNHSTERDGNLHLHGSGVTLREFPNMDDLEMGNIGVTTSVNISSEVNGTFGIGPDRSHVGDGLGGRGIVPSTWRQH